MTVTVLVIDDEPDSRSGMAETLKLRGYSVLEAGNGREALDLLLDTRASEPEVIVLDLAMPVMSGWEFVAIVKSYYRLARIPVIAVSGKEKPDLAMRHGVIADFVEKPHEPDAFVSVVDAWSGRSPPSPKVA